MDKNKKIHTEQEAREYAIEWQKWVADQNLSYGELLDWGIIFERLANKFKLEEEFKENGIIWNNTTNMTNMGSDTSLWIKKSGFGCASGWF